MDTESYCCKEETAWRTRFVSNLKQKGWSAVKEVTDLERNRWVFAAGTVTYLTASGHPWGCIGHTSHQHPFSSTHRSRLPLPKCVLGARAQQIRPAGCPASRAQPTPTRAQHCHLCHGSGSVQVCCAGKTPRNDLNGRHGCAGERPATREHTLPVPRHEPRASPGCPPWKQRFKRWCEEAHVPANVACGRKVRRSGIQLRPMPAV